MGSTVVDSIGGMELYPIPNPYTLSHVVDGRLLQGAESAFSDDLGDEAGSKRILICRLILTEICFA